MIHLWFGEDTFSILQELTALREKFVQKNSEAVIEDLEFSPETEDEDLRTNLQRLFGNQGLFSRNKMIILRNFLGEINQYPLAQDYLFQNLENFSPLHTLVFFEEELVDKRLKLFRQLQKIAKVKEFVVPVDKALKTWINQYLEKWGFKITEPGVENLLRRLGEDYNLWQVDGELQKLILYSWSTKIIEGSAVQQIVPQNITQNIFNLTDLVAQNQIPQALTLLEQMIGAVQTSDTKTQIIQIVGALAFQIRSLLLVKDLAEQHSQAEIARFLDWKEGRVWINLKLAKKFTKERLIGLIQNLKAIDFRLKTSEEPPKLLLALFFQKAQGNA